MFGNNLSNKEIIGLAKESNYKILIDGAQAIAHQKIDIQDLILTSTVFLAIKCTGQRELAFVMHQIVSLMKCNQLVLEVT